MFTYLISFINFITHYSQLKVNKFLLNVKTEFPSQTCIWLFILHSLTFANRLCSLVGSLEGLRSAAAI